MGHMNSIPMESVSDITDDFDVPIVANLDRSGRSLTETPIRTIKLHSKHIEKIGNN